MIESHLFLDTFSLLAPFFTAATCFIFVAFSHHDCLTLDERRLKNVLLTYLALNASVWSSIFCYYYVPQAFAYLSALFLVINILSPVFFFRILGSLMKTERHERFSRLHYIAPVAIGVGAMVWSFLLPVDTQEVVIGKIAGDPAGRKLIASPITIARALFVVVYYSLFMRQLIRYFRWAQKSKNVIPMPARWVAYLIIMSLFPLYFALAALVKPPDKLLSGMGGAIAALLAFVQLIMITHHIVRRQYLLYSKMFDETSEGCGQVTKMNEQ